ncbi:MAG TPA: hypothetical protein V6C86_20275 [Oculatellaceae cyanobacterium]
MSIDEKYLNQLRQAGLHISPPVPAFRGGVWVGKPKDVSGNNIPGYSGGYATVVQDAPPCPDIDAPLIKFMLLDDIWVVDGHDSCGGTGPADFVDEWATPEEAIADILDYFFGDPARMKKKAEEQRLFQERLKRLKAMEP